jgi:hypothetical protein
MQINLSRMSKALVSFESICEKEGFYLDIVEYPSNMYTTFLKLRGSLVLGIFCDTVAFGGLPKYSIERLGHQLLGGKVLVLGRSIKVVKFPENMSLEDYGHL